MNEEVEAPDLSEKYQAHAYWALDFICDGCLRNLETYPNERQFSRAWFVGMAEQAKAEGWFVPEHKNEISEMICYCPACKTLEPKPNWKQK